jgi:hypothetical protein
MRHAGERHLPGELRRSVASDVRPRVLLLAWLCAGLGGSGCGEPDASPGTVALRINELMASNDGVWIDEHGTTADWIELLNAGDTPIQLGELRIEDDGMQPVPLPDRVLQPGETLVLFADESPERGALHLGFKLSAGGDAVRVSDARGRIIDELRFEAQATNESLARLPDGAGEPAPCRYATPARLNGGVCEAPAPPELSDEVAFKDFSWPRPFPALTGPLVISELALRPAEFVEVLNASNDDVALDGIVLGLAAHAPGLPWPTPADGTRFALAGGSLAPGERVTVALTPTDLDSIEAGGRFEGVASLFDPEGGLIDRVDFMDWPAGAALTRVPDAGGRHRFCATLTPGQANSECDALASREVGDRLRHLYTPGDFAALASGGTALDAASVKFVIDIAHGDVVHLLGSSWPLHYAFWREQIQGEPALDRCDPDQNEEFHTGWTAFSEREYRQVEGRTVLTGELTLQAGSGLKTVDFTTGDQISPDQMKRTFFGVAAHLDEPSAWALHPQSDSQTQRMLELDGQLPIVAQNAPFRGVSYQPLTAGVAYGTLQFIPANELSAASLGPRVIVVTDDVPNDIPLVAGLVTEAFQTPLAHVNVLSQGRNTPNMALRGAHEELGALLGALVKLEVGAAGYAVREAQPEEAEAFWASRTPTVQPFVARLDTSVRGVVALDQPGRGLSDLPSVGAKAAQLAELHRIRITDEGCPGALPLPPHPAAIALVHSVEHFEASGARARLDTLRAEAGFRTDPAMRAQGLAEVQELVLAQPVDPALLAEVQAHVAQHFGSARVRYRSSSNTEDLPEFNGAGLYTSESAELDDEDRTAEEAIRTVWASLWNTRAYDERELAHVDQDSVAMGVLIHPAFRTERANGVAISRNVLDPIRGDEHYLNLQAGEASVTNPAPGVVTEQIVFIRFPFPGVPQGDYQSQSSLVPGRVATLDELRHVSCVLGGIHDHFRPLLDPDGTERWFAMQIELKFLGDARTLLVKQARPHHFGGTDIPDDCREF